ncbi:cupin domain-containing protein [Synechocystis salina LEGE 06155]|nr:cupin domain-containing protein [Synechocystis salina LEGE 06155]
MKSAALLLSRLLLVLLVVLGTLTVVSPKALAIATLDNFPSPNIEKTEKILGPAGEIFEFSTCNAKGIGFTIANAQIPAGAGPLPHIHHYTNEWFWTPQGGLELFQSAKEYPDLNNPATVTQGGNATIYTVQTQPNQIVYGPKYRVHGFVNVTSETRPLTFIWRQDPTSPEYEFHDGGIREYFKDVGIPIKNMKKLPKITDQAREKFVTHAPDYGINQSYYFLQYVNRVDNQPPEALANLKDDQGLSEIIETINAYNQGDSSVTCF